MSALESFVAIACEYSEWCLSPAEDESTEARKALRLLVRLYAAALELRNPEVVEQAERLLGKGHHHAR